MHRSDKTRREFLSGMAVSTGLLVTRAGAAASRAGDDVRLDPPADVTLRVAPVKLEVASGRIVNTVGYNGTSPGPVVRFREGVPATVELINDTATPEYVHWHGFDIPCDVDGAEEEGSLVVPAHGRLRYRLTPNPPGSRYVHTHNMSMSDLNRGAFTGQFAFAYVEPKHDPGKYDQEVFLATHEWDPYLTHMDAPEDSTPQRPMPQRKGKKDNKPHGWEVGYRHFTINGRCLGHGEPIRVKEGQRVLFHFLNASATESVRFALPGHRFRVVALDGNPVPRPQLVDVLDLGTAERVDAVVEMNSPGVFVLGTPRDSHRAKGMGVVVEYANRTGTPRWVRPPASRWDYTIFGERRPALKPDVVVPLVIRQADTDKGGFDQWTINGKIYDARNPPTPLTKGRRHRLVFDNQSDDVHPVHWHRNSFELVNVYGKPTSGVMKDVVVVRSRQKVEVDVTPHMEGLTLFHCHQQLHMDYGFKMLFNVA